ncbi:hypothetical protein BGZ65_009552 [Modicella reniformis]|uniref:Uncharacterized protein n=1 Tax=Modicella reniformis TaxID=1440133 RepID=A0A9P6SUZ2_9FUNG|nr:hypothetical protein BGZ65_009552 [Modicella reniformis]
MNGINMSLTTGLFKAALRIVRFTLEQRINHTAQTSLANDIVCVAAGLRSASLVEQLFLSENDIERIQSFFHHSARFSQLDVLRIGQDHVFIIHRELLLKDIHEYLKGSSTGLQRVFVNVDRHLPQPEVIPKNRYRALEEYILEELLPEIQERIEYWDQADRSHRALPTPCQVSMVTLTGWILGYPVIYVFPLSMATRKRLVLEAARRRRLQERQRWRLPGQYVEDTNEDGEKEGEEEDEEEEEDEGDVGRNCLANQALVVTKVYLEPSNEMEGLRNHCLLSFSYPVELAELWMDRSTVLPESPCTPLTLPSPTAKDQEDEQVDEKNEYDDDHDDYDDERSGNGVKFVDVSDVESDADTDTDISLLSSETLLSYHRTYNLNYRTTVLDVDHEDQDQCKKEGVRVYSSTCHRLNLLPFPLPQ